MQLKDTVFKYLGRDLWMHHTASTYKVRVNGETMARLSGLLAKRPGDVLTSEEGFLHRKLQAREMIVGAPDGAAQLHVKQKSCLDSIELEFSGTCNLSCGHCFAAMTGKMMRSDVLEKVLRGALELDAISLIFSGGEPLLNPIFPQACQMAREMDLRVIVMTNATAVTEECAREMESAKVAEVVVSLDFFEEYHDRLRGQGAFESAASGIRTMVRRHLPLHVTAMVTDHNIDSIEEFKKFCLADLGVSGVRFSAVIPMGKAAQSSREPDFLLSDANFGRIFRAACPDEEGPAQPNAVSETTKGFKCSAGSRQVFVAADGQVYPCHYFQNLGEAIGDLDVESLADIYRRNSEGGLTSSFDRNSLGECVSCGKFAECQGGCRARAKILEGSIFSPDPVACRIHGMSRAKRSLA